jgi:hypothetical protein
MSTAPVNLSPVPRPASSVATEDDHAMMTRGNLDHMGYEDIQNPPPLMVKQARTQAGMVMRRYGLVPDPEERARLTKEIVEDYISNGNNSPRVESINDGEETHQYDDAALNIDDLDVPEDLHDAFNDDPNPLSVAFRTAGGNWDDLPRSIAMGNIVSSHSCKQTDLSL